MYKTLPTGVLRTTDNTFIPLDEASPAYREFLAWKGAGNVPASMDEVPASELARRELDALERETMMNRGMREYLLVSMQDLAMRKSAQMAEAGIAATPQEILAADAAWNRLVAINTKAAALRARLK